MMLENAQTRAGLKEEQRCAGAAGNRASITRPGLKERRFGIGWMA